MGSYDKIRVTCPHCLRGTEVQSKGGECMFKDYDQSSVPLDVASYLHESYEVCDKCHKPFIVLANPPLVRLSTEKITHEVQET